MSGLEQVRTLKALDAVLDQNHRVVVYFSSKLSAECEKIYPIVVALSKNPQYVQADVTWVIIDVDSSKGIVAKYDAADAPLFVFFRNRAKIDVIKEIEQIPSSIEKLTNKVLRVTSRHEFEKVRAVSRIVFAHFFAEWVKLCLDAAPEFEELAKANQDIRFVKIDIDQCEQLAVEYQISTIPAFMTMRDGEPVGFFMGRNFHEGLRKLLSDIREADKEED
mmetsp:Transcript_13561/g.24270  ORF Transcript_13561/g.24270 Transcript_13561/m.24270 type:complete len:220 (-) Transcript_13561:314-973(-)